VAKKRVDSKHRLTSCLLCRYRVRVRYAYSILNLLYAGLHFCVYIDLCTTAWLYSWLIYNYRCADFSWGQTIVRPLTHRFTYCDTEKPCSNVKTVMICASAGRVLPQRGLTQLLYTGSTKSIKTICYDTGFLPWMRVRVICLNEFNVCQHYKAK
jgi:hypothetical protein